MEGDGLINRLASKAKVIEGYGRPIVDGSSVVGVKVGEELIKGEGFLLATGYLSEGALKPFNLQLGLKTLRGHLVVSRPIGLRNIVILEDRIFVEGENLLMDGDATEAVKRTLDFDAVSKTLETFERGFGIEPEVLEVRVGMRTVSTDGKPVVQKVAENAVLVTGYRFGFALAPHMAKEGLRILF